MYGFDPCIQEACLMYDKLFDRHYRQLSYLELNWDQVRDDKDKLIQILPVVIAQFKGF